MILAFMTEEALTKFRDQQRATWEIGVDGSVAVAKLGAGGEIDTTNIRAPIVAFVFGQKGLMANISLEGSRIAKIEKPE